jgi:hypothetical protein
MLAGIAVALVGLLVLLMGWNGLEGETDVAVQLPFLFSGGVGGVVLVAVGGALVILDEIARTRRRLDDLEGEILNLIKDLRDDLAEPLGIGAGRPG